MPGWFVTLGYITLAVLMGSFLLGMAIAIIVTVIVFVKTWHDDWLKKHLNKRKE